MPTNYVKTGSHDKTPSDLGYFTMGGKRDYIPDVFYGRFVVDSIQDLEVQGSKKYQFEQGSYGDKSGYKRQIGIASDEGYDPTDVEYLKDMQEPLEKAFGMKPYKFLQEKINSTPENINKVLSKGAVWLNYIGHGEGSTWRVFIREVITLTMLKIYVVKGRSSLLLLMSLVRMVALPSIID